MGDPAWHNSNNSQVHGNFVQAGVINAERIIFGSSEDAGPAIPDTLPAKPTGFLDREHESGRLDELLRAAEAAGTQLLALLPGMQGVGKTTLAVHWGRSNRHLFPDGALFADLAASAPGGPAGADEVLGGFLAQLGVPPAMTPVRTADRQAVFRNLTSGRRMLVVLDDAASTAQVTEVLPASERSCVLVTTRKTLGLDAVSVPVEPFGSEHAEALAGRDLGEPVSDDDRAALRKVANACGGHPLALDLLRGKLAGRVPLASYVDGILSRGLCCRGCGSTTGPSSPRSRSKRCTRSCPPRKNALSGCWGRIPVPRSRHARPPRCSTCRSSRPPNSWMTCSACGC
ncbi:NB-ARC domain-containing protein [Saccharopolyspora sp. SCSIO 74807]|uniref:NB-ARC domain-containing protein n=1 Tax=Saccharopolyspora sp. SCSIO 74807 TaxID=3118084 RepID=UPI0030CAFCEC